MSPTDTGPSTNVVQPDVTMPLSASTDVHRARSVRRATARREVSCARQRHAPRRISWHPTQVVQFRCGPKPLVAGLAFKHHGRVCGAIHQAGPNRAPLVKFVRRRREQANQRVRRRTTLGLKHQGCLVKIGIVQQMRGVKQRRAVKEPGVIEEVVVGQVIPFSAGKTQVPGRAIFEALQAMDHQHLSVRRVLLAGKLKPTPTGVVVGRGRVVLGFPCVRLHPRGVARVRLRGKRCQQQRGKNKDGGFGQCHGANLRCPK